jgi:hypothetical protein
LRPQRLQRIPRYLIRAICRPAHQSRDLPAMFLQ